MWLGADGSRKTGATLRQDDTFSLSTRPGTAPVIRDEKQRLLGHCVAAMTPDKTVKAVISQS